MNKRKFISNITLFILSVFICSLAFPLQVRAKDAEGNVVIVIDPGHGGGESGAVSTVGDIEQFLNWDIARFFKAELETYAGVKVYLARANNEWHTNTGRAQMGINVNADLVVSIHNNSSESPDPSGFCVYGTVNPELSQTTSQIAQYFIKYAKNAGLSLSSSGYFVRSSSDDPGSDFHTIIDEGSKAGIPTIIVEHCFLSNSAEAEFVHEPDNRRKYGVIDATAVAEYFGLSKRTISEGGYIELERNSSVYFVPSSKGEGDVVFSSSDENIAYVRYDGLVTAVNPGKATVEYKYADGKTGQITFVTKEVKMVGVTAGLNPTVYHTKEEVAAIDKNNVIVKAIYSDGTVRQVLSGFTVGDIDPEIFGRQFVTVEYNGFTGRFSIYRDPSKYKGNYSMSLRIPVGDFTDPFVLPGRVWIEGISGAPAVPDKPSEPVTEPATESVTEPATEPATEPVTEPATETQPETPTDNTTESISEDAANNTGQEISTTQQPTMDEPVFSSKDTDSSADKVNWIVVVFLVITILILICVILLIFISQSRNSGGRGNRNTVVKRKRRK